MIDAPRPHDDAAEQALLGAVLTGYPIDQINLTADDFHQTRNGDVWAACLRIADSGRKPEPALILGTLGDEMGGYLIELVGAAGVGSNVPSYARTITAHADARRLMDLALGVFQQASMGTPADSISEHVRSELDRMERRAGTTLRLDEIMPELIDAIQAGGTRGPSLPWPDLDKVVKGLQPGRLYTIGARPGRGKSLFGQALAWHWATQHGRDTFVASMEMPRSEYAMRFLSADSGVPLGCLESGSLDDPKWDRVGRTVSKIHGVPLYICDDDTQSVRTIAANARAAARGGKLGLIVVDYLQLMEPDNKRMEREQQVADITKRLKRLAKRLHVPVVLLSQLNREGVKGTEEREPRVSDLRESGAIEQDSDAVILLHQIGEPDPRDPDRVTPIDAIVAKNRSGPSGWKSPLLIRGSYARIVSRA